MASKVDNELKWRRMSSSGGGMSRHVKWSSASQAVQHHLTACIHELVLQSQTPHTINNLLFTITNQNNELTISTLGRVPETIKLIRSVRKRMRGSDVRGRVLPLPLFPDATPDQTLQETLTMPLAGKNNINKHVVSVWPRPAVSVARTTPGATLTIKNGSGCRV